MYAVADAGGLLCAAGVVLRGPQDEAVETWCALTLAEALRVPFVTKHEDVRSKVVPVLHC